MIKYVVFLLSIYMINFVRNVIVLIQSKKYILEYKEQTKFVSSLTEKVYIFIPMLNEQKIAIETINSFYHLIKDNDNYNLVFVTSNKEEGIVTTKEILLKRMEEIKSEQIKLFNYPYNDGIMAHQLNYGIKKIREIEKEEFWISIYNADSRINLYTLQGFEQIVNERKGIAKRYCIQQYSFFALHVQKKIINGAVMWQNRWSILFEIARAKFQIKFNENLNNKKEYQFVKLIFEKMNYVIGHGCVGGQRDTQ